MALKSVTSVKWTAMIFNLTFTLENSWKIWKKKKLNLQLVEGYGSPKTLVCSTWARLKTFYYLGTVNYVCKLLPLIFWMFFEIFENTSYSLNWLFSKSYQLNQKIMTRGWVYAPFFVSHGFIVELEGTVASDFDQKSLMSDFDED